MRILQIGITHEKGGIPACILGLSHSLRDLGHEVLVIGTGGEEILKLEEDGIGYHEILMSRKLPLIISASRSVRKILNDFQPDIVHTHSRSTSLMCLLSGRRADWFSLHSQVLMDRVGILDRGFIRKYFSPTAKNIFVLSRSAHDYVVSELGFAEDRVLINPNGIDLSYFRPPSTEERQESRKLYSVQPEETLILFAGRYSEEKQPEAVLELAKVLRENGIGKMRFAFIGKGRLAAKMKDFIKNNHLSDYCDVYEWREPRSAYWAADLVVMPSSSEGFGLVTVEAQACECPVLRSRTGGFESTVIENVTGFICDTSIDSFVEIGLDVLRNKEQLKGMRKAASEFAAKEFGLMTHTEKTLVAYKKGLEPNR